MTLERSEKWNRYMRQRSFREARARTRFKKYRKNRNRYVNHLSDQSAKENHQSRQIHHQANKYKTVVAPNVLSFVKNPEGVSEFVRQLKLCFKNRAPVWVKLKGVNSIEYDGINVLLSVVILFKSHRIRFNGDYPTDQKVKLSLQSSGFFEHLYETKFREKKEYSLKRTGIISTHAMKKVDSELGEQLVKLASSFVWGEPRRCFGLQRTFIELMQNTNNHASLEETGEKHWWLSVQFDSVRKVACFSFVDYGVGVFENLSKKIQGNKFYRLLEALQERVNFGPNSEVLKLILNGELHKTASGKYYRGKGLPGIYEALTNGSISNLSIVTNDVYFSSQGDKFQTLKPPFSGTFVYWELEECNRNLPSV